MESMTSYIRSIFSSSVISLSWGAHSYTALDGDKGLSFVVNGFIYQGEIFIVYNAGSDAFNVTIGSETFEDIFIDQLISIIDSKVEKDCGKEEYDNKVETWLASDSFKEMFGYTEEE